MAQMTERQRMAIVEAAFEDWWRTHRHKVRRLRDNKDLFYLAFVDGGVDALEEVKYPKVQPTTGTQ